MASEERSVEGSRPGDGAIGVQAWSHFVQAANQRHAMTPAELATALCGDPSRLDEAGRAVLMVGMYCLLSGLPPLDATLNDDSRDEACDPAPRLSAFAFDWQSAPEPTDRAIAIALARLRSDGG